jgi:hypothetical protein
VFIYIFHYEFHFLADVISYTKHDPVCHRLDSTEVVVSVLGTDWIICVLQTPRRISVSPSYYKIGVEDSFTEG